MISTMSLVETEEPAPDERPPLTAPFWVQYQLDSAGTVEEVIANDAVVRVTDAYDHYLVCDRTGDCAVIEFPDGEMVVYTSPTLPTRTLANSTYEDSLAALEDGDYWRVEALPFGPWRKGLLAVRVASLPRPVGHRRRGSPSPPSGRRHRGAPNPAGCRSGAPGTVPAHHSSSPRPRSGIHWGQPAAQSGTRTVRTRSQDGI